MSLTELLCEAEEAEEEQKPRRPPALHPTGHQTAKISQTQSGVREREGG